MVTPDTPNGLFIGGHWTIGSGRLFSVDNPADGQVIATVADGDATDAAHAVQAAASAATGWARTSPRRRSEILYTAFEIMLRSRRELAELIVAENGKCGADAGAEVTYAAEYLRWFAEEAVRNDGTYTHAPAGGTRSIVRRQPIGIAALVTPWNFPAAMVTRKVGPALAAGCTVVLKPAAETPLTALSLAKILSEAGLPDGVVNVVPSTDPAVVVSTWLHDPRVRKISFTGSTPVGRLLLHQAADRVVNSSMELGGNAPFIVTRDADLDQAVAGAMIAKFRNSGQACTAANRFYIHQDVAAEFTTRFADRVCGLRVGPACDPDNQIGPLINAEAVSTITNLVDKAVQHGARIAARATCPANSTGYFYPPTVLIDVSADADILGQEIFGPVAPIVTWNDERTLLDHVNNTETGLAAYIYAGDLQHALRLGESVQAGMIGVNRSLISDPAAPFGGIKQSGLGREGGHEGLHDYTEIQYLSVDWP
ncbi:NAD-dependent succinate-semialdehyde dehydrogenase [Nocardia arthritidis]|uniref:NAD-dependent succinate-semialdehyde dehydrogenase n=1 Tax=Nocardia arthritidis TaxID=228602 RepID=UPI0007A4AB26|nr:NAD-dependent succinate-semialdehyde dehydrogenase [Nocardia arthritidis]